MKVGDLVRVKTGYGHPDVSPYGVIVDEILSTASVRFGSGDMFRTFHVAFPVGVFRMMAYEFENVTAENTDGVS